MKSLLFISIWVFFTLHVFANEQLNKHPELHDKSQLIRKKVFSKTEDSCLSNQTPIKLSKYFYKKIDSTWLNKRLLLSAYVFTPTAHNPKKHKLPVVAMFHGGGWRNGTPATWFPAAKYLASRGGVVAISFQYRLIGNTGRNVHESIADSLSAIRWIRKNAIHLGINPNKIMSVGDSAGGHLALSTFLVNKITDEVKGVDSKFSSRTTQSFVLYPIANTAKMAVSSVRSDRTEFSPRHLISSRNAVSTMIIQGTNDEHHNTSPSSVKSYCRIHRAKNKSAPCEYVSIPGLTHAFYPSATSLPRSVNGTRLQSNPNIFVLTKLDGFLMRHRFIKKRSLAFTIKSQLNQSCTSAVSKNIWETRFRML